MNQFWVLQEDVAPVDLNTFEAHLYALAECQQQTTATLAAVDDVKKLLDNVYGYSGWTTAKARRTSGLHIDSKSDMDRMI